MRPTSLALHKIHFLSSLIPISTYATLHCRNILHTTVSSVYTLSSSTFAARVYFKGYSMHKTSSVREKCSSAKGDRFHDTACTALEVVNHCSHDARLAISVGASLEPARDRCEQVRVQ